MCLTTPKYLLQALLILTGFWIAPPPSTDNEQPPKKPTETDKATEIKPTAFKVFVFGDSNAAGYGPFVAPALSSTAANYGPYDISNTKTSPYASDDFYYRWASHSGKTAALSNRFLAPRNGQHPNLLPSPLGYDVIFYQMGTNDTAHRKDFDSDQAYVADVRKGIVEALATLKNDYKAKTIYVVLPPPIFQKGTPEELEKDALAKSAWSNLNMEKILPVIREVARENSLKIVDINAEFKGKEKTYGASVHYNDTGRKKVAELYVDAIRGDIEPVRFFSVAGEKETEIKAMQQGKVLVKTAFNNNTLPTKYRPKIQAILYKDDAGKLTEVQAQSLDERISPKSSAIQVEFDVPATGNYVIKTFVWRDAAMTTPNPFSAPYLSILR